MKENDNNIIIGVIAIVMVLLVLIFFLYNAKKEVLCSVGRTQNGYL